MTTNSETTRHKSNEPTILAALWNGKWIIIACMLVAFVASSYYASSMITPVYRATTKIIMSSQEQQVVNLETIAPGFGTTDSREINSEAEVLRSRSLLGKVVDQLELEKDPEFNPYIREPDAKSRIKGAITARVRALFGWEVPEGTAPDDETIHADVVSTLRNAIRVQNVSDTLIFDIHVSSVSPRKAALIANTVAERYILEQLEVKYDATQQATVWLSDRVVELQADLEQANAEVTNFRASIELVSDEGLLAQERQLRELRDRLSNLETSSGMIRDRLDRMEAADTNEARAASVEDAQLNDMLSRIDQPGVQQAFDARFEALLQRNRTDLQRIQQQQATVQTGYDTLQEQIDGYGQDLIRLEQLTREAEASRLLYEHFLSRLKETAAQEGIQQADSRILSSSVVPKLPSEPDIGLIVTMWSILGVLVGIGWVALRHMTRNTILTPRDLEVLTHQVVMGQIPRLRTKRRLEFMKYFTTHPTSELVEAVRNVRTSLELSNVDRPPRIVAVTSSLPGEGKTTMSMALASSASMAGKKCLLIEGDFRRRMLKEVLGEKTSNGLVAVLSGDKRLDEAVIPSELMGCDVLQAEVSNVNVADIFSSNRFSQLIETALSTYDFIVIDTPPILLVPDARIIMQHTDATLFLAAWNRTTKSQIEEAMRIFQTSHNRLTGCILNGIDRRDLQRMGYGSYYGNQGSHYYQN